MGFFLKKLTPTADIYKRNKKNFLFLYLLIFILPFAFNHQSVLQTFLMSLMAEKNENMVLEYYVCSSEHIFSNKLYCMTIFQF